MSDLLGRDIDRIVIRACNHIHSLRSGRGPIEDMDTFDPKVEIIAVITDALLSDEVVEAAAEGLYSSDANTDPIRLDRMDTTESEWERHLAFYRSEGHDPQGFFPAFMLAKKSLQAVTAALTGEADGAEEGGRG